MQQLLQDLLFNEAMHNNEHSLGHLECFGSTSSPETREQGVTSELRIGEGKVARAARGMEADQLQQADRPVIAALRGLTEA